MEYVDAASSLYISRTTLKQNDIKRSQMRHSE